MTVVTRLGRIAKLGLERPCFVKAFSQPRRKAYVGQLGFERKVRKAPLINEGVVMERCARSKTIGVCNEPDVAICPTLCLPLAEQ